MMMRSPRKVSALKPADWNPRTISDPDLARLGKSLERLGDLGGIVFNRRSDNLVGGHQRARKLPPGAKIMILRQHEKPTAAGTVAEGFVEAWGERFSYREVDWPPAEERLANLAANNQAGEFEPLMLGDLLSELKKFSVDLKDLDLDLVGLDAKEIDRLISGSAVAHAEQECDYEDDDADRLDRLFNAPFPYFGGKSRVAGRVWAALGDVQCYIEPFFGSGAVLLNRPQPFVGVETVNDIDGMIANFWRAVQQDPDAVAQHADWPTLENCLHARHSYLIGRKESLQAKLEGDPDYCDPKIAGWWVWGMALWIGGGFCSGAGPWSVVEGDDGTRRLVHLGGAQGVNRKRVHLGDAGRGVKRRLVHLGGARGVKRRLVHLGGARSEGKAGCGEQGLLAWMQALAQRLKRVRVCCGDWTRICGGDSGDALSHMVQHAETCGIFLDPPYADTAGRDPTVYTCDDLVVAHAVRDWAVRHGDDPRLRIVLAGYEAEHEMPASWRVLRWKAAGGMASVGNNAGKLNCFRERLWLSPHCVTQSLARQTGQEVVVNGAPSGTHARSRRRALSRDP